MLAFLGPAVLALAVVGIIPLFYAIWKSLHFFNLTKVAQTRFVGLDNYATVLTDQVFWQAMARTALLFLLSVPVQIALGLGIALVLHRPGLGFSRRHSAVFGAADGDDLRRRGAAGAGDVQHQVRRGEPDARLDRHRADQLDRRSGQRLHRGDLLGHLAVDAVRGPGVRRASTVPPEIEEAAQLETKRWWTILRHVQLPFLVPGLVAVLILRTADTLKLFDMVFTMTRGGPGSATEFIAILIERVGNRQFDIGMASAQALIMLVITIVLARLYIRFFYREVW